MNRQTAQKADFFIQGLLSRMEDGADFFEGITCTFRSGGKSFSFQADLAEERFCFFFQGQRCQMTAGELCAFIKDQIPLFDAMTFCYKERGKTYLVEADEKKVTAKTADELPAAAQMSASSASLGNREYFVRPDRAARVLETLGILGKNGKVRNDKIRKYNQIDHFVELLDPLLRELAAVTDTIRVIDMGCGKSYLDFVLNYYIREVLGKKCHFTGLDINPVVIRDSEEMAAALQYRNMRFIETDIGNFQPEGKYDLLLTLHACDTATDKALSFGILNDVRAIVCVPCCHKEMNAQYHLDGLDAILKYGVLKARIADSLTDGMRGMYLEAMGYEVSMVEYISPLDTPKNLMMKAFLRGEKDIARLNRFFETEKLLGTDLSVKK